MLIVIVLLDYVWKDVTNNVVIDSYKGVIDYVNKYKYLVKNDKCFTGRDLFWYYKPLFYKELKICKK